jgi:hypothetical protein
MKKNNNQRNNKTKVSRGRRQKNLRPSRVNDDSTIYTNTKPISFSTAIPRLVSPRYILTQLDGNCVSSWTIVDVTPILQGTGDTNRLGRYARVHQLEMHYSLNAQNADIFSRVRVVLVQWKPESGNQPFNMAEVFQTNNYIYSPYNIDAAGGYSFLYDESFAMSGTASAPTVSGCIIRRIRCNKGFQKNQLYASLTAQSFNKIFFCYLSDSALIPFPSLSGVGTVKFFT